MHVLVDADGRVASGVAVGADAVLGLAESRGVSPSKGYRRAEWLYAGICSVTCDV